MRHPGPDDQGGGGWEVAWPARLPYADRRSAGRYLGQMLAQNASGSDMVVLGLPRGGVPVAYEVATALGAPMDVFGVRKLGVPGQEELALGAVASGGATFINESVVSSFRISQAVIEAVTAAALRQLADRELLFREGLDPLEVRGRSVVLVDDGLATGATMRAAVAALRSREPGRIVVAVPVAPPDVCARLRLEVDHLVCAAEPEPFTAVGFWYEDFTPVSTEEVRDLVRLGRQQDQAPSC